MALSVTPTGLPEALGVTDTDRRRFSNALAVHSKLANVAVTIANTHLLEKLR